MSPRSVPAAPWRPADYRAPARPVEGYGGAEGARRPDFGAQSMLDPIQQQQANRRTGLANPTFTGAGSWPSPMKRGGSEDNARSVLAPTDSGAAAPSSGQSRALFAKRSGFRDSGAISLNQRANDRSERVRDQQTQSDSTPGSEWRATCSRPCSGCCFFSMATPVHLPSHSMTPRKAVFSPRPALAVCLKLLESPAKSGFLDRPHARRHV
jgi:hypothetical protein